MNLYRDESSTPKWNAQRNLCGRTHYVDDETLRYHKSRVLSTHIAGNGLLFALIESYAVDHNNTRRAFRPVVFDVFGTVLSRVGLEEGFKYKEAARSKLSEILREIDAKAHTLKAIDTQQRYAIQEFDALRAKVGELAKAKET